MAIALNVSDWKILSGPPIRDRIPFQPTGPDVLPKPATLLIPAGLLPPPSALRRGPGGLRGSPAHGPG